MPFFKTKKTKNLFLWRSILSKLLGLAIGVAVAAYLLQFQPDLSLHVVIAIILWFTMQGGIIALMGFVTRHPLFTNWKISAWQRGMAIGVFMHLMLVLFLYDQFDWAVFIPDWLPVQDPIILTMVEGAILGLLWDSLITAATGDGKKLIKSL